MIHNKKICYLFRTFFIANLLVKSAINRYCSQILYPEIFIFINLYIYKLYNVHTKPDLSNHTDPRQSDQKENEITIVNSTDSVCLLVKF